MMRSTLELRVGGLPLPRGDTTGWRYRHAVRAEGVTVLDQQAVADFMENEAANGREVSVTTDSELANWSSWPRPAVRPVPGSRPVQCCTYVYAAGCGSPPLVCHEAPLGAVGAILAAGALRSSASLTGMTPEALAARSSWGEPPDYFRYVMFANGRCTAPEAVASSRVLGRDLVPDDLRPGYAPAARFYFRWDSLRGLGDAVFDGVHPVKVLNGVALEPHLVALVIPSDADVMEVPAVYQDRVKRLPNDRPGPEVWATRAARQAAELL